MYLNFRPTFPSTKELRRNEYIILILLAMWILLAQFDFLLQMHGMMEGSYLKYNFNKSDYIAVSATVKEIEIYKIKLTIRPPYGIPTYSFNRLLICYKLDGIEHNVWTKLYPEYTVGDNIQIAVDNSNNMKIQRTQPYSIKNIPSIVWIICVFIWILYFLGLYRVIKLYKIEDEGSPEYDISRPTYIEQQTSNEIIIRREQEQCIKLFVKESGMKRDELHVDTLKYNLLLNNASKWYVNEGASIGDVILLNDDNGESLCLKETEYLKRYGLPEDYYVVAVKDTYWLCCHAEEEYIYNFSKTVGLTHTKYRSLYDYIIETCNIPFTLKNIDD